MSEPQRIKSVGCKIKECDTHGEYEAMPWKDGTGKIRYTVCPECSALINARKEAEEKEEERQRYYFHLTAAGISKRFINSSFEGYNPVTENAQKALKTVIRYRDRFQEMKDAGTSLILCGRPGTGKTHLASALAISLLTGSIPKEKSPVYQGMSLKYTTSFQMMARIKATYNKYDAKETESSVIAALTQCDLLIIDEVGVQFGSEAEKVLFYQIINGRYDNVLPTVLISNLTAKELEQFIGERCFDRLRENSGAVLPFDWESYRK